MDEFGTKVRERSPSPSLNWLVVILLFVVAALLWRDRLFRTRSSLTDPLAEPRVVTPRGDLAADEKAVVELFREVSPSVVHITTLTRAEGLLTFNAEDVPQGTGSGFVWDRDGHVVTNYHVIEKSNSVQVTLSDQSTWEARLVGADPNKDLAVLKIDVSSTTLRPILVGLSRDLAVGQKVFAIGNPFGLDQTLTTGIISALGREIQSVTRRPIRGVIQTDAAINPGNSGGPLLDSAGRLIGVNTAIYSPSGASSGIGFAVPVDIVNRVVPQIIRTGKPETVGMGIAIAEDQITRRLGREGVLVLHVVENGAAAKAGLRPTRVAANSKIELGDFIVAIDGKSIRSADDLFRVIDDHRPGDVIKVTILREGKRLELSVELQILQ